MLGLLATFALSAAGAPLASAAEPKWWVEGALLTGSEAIAEATSVPTAFKLEVKSPKVTIECTKMKVKGAKITAPATRTEESEIFEGCSIVGIEGCTVANAATAPLTAKLEAAPKEGSQLNFKPQKEGGEIATWTVTGKSCAVAGTYTASGTMICSYPEVSKESVEHKLEFTSGSGSKVTVSGEAAGFVGTDVVKLTSGKKWSAR